MGVVPRREVRDHFRALVWSKQKAPDGQAHSKNFAQSKCPSAALEWRRQRTSNPKLNWTRYQRRRKSARRTGAVQNLAEVRGFMDRHALAPIVVLLVLKTLP